MYSNQPKGTEMASRYYVGSNQAAGIRQVFKADQTPTVETHGHIYKSVVGPFRTKRGAMFHAAVGANNPHVQHVNDDERIAKRMA